MKIPVNSQLKLYLICCFVSLGGFMYGYDSGVTSAILLMPTFQQKFHITTDSSASVAVVPVSLAASFLASFASGFLADGFGRKRFLYVATIIHEIGCIVEVTGHTQASFFAGRILTGLSVGVYSMLVPLYQSEVAKPRNRGRLISFYQIFVTLGFCTAFWLVFGIYRIQGDLVWKAPLGTQLIAGGIMLFGIYFIPESPRWLIYKDRPKEALQILASLRSKGDTLDVDVQMEYTGIVQDVTFDKIVYKQRFLSLLKKGNDNNLKRTLLGMGIHTFTQLSGINALLFYLPHILESAGLREIYSALLGNGIGGIVNFVATVCVLFYIDRWNRRFILVCGAIGMGCCMLAIAIVSAVFNQELVNKVAVYGDVNEVGYVTPGATYAIIVLLNLFIAFFALSWGPVGWIYPAEIYPQMIRANAMGVTTSCSYLFNLIISLVAPIMFRDIVWGTYLFFAAFCFIMATVIHLYYPETRGRSLEEIQLIFSGALIDERPDAHHPSTAAEALLHLEQIQHRDKRDQMARNNEGYPFTFPDTFEVSSPHNVTRVFNNRASHESTTPSPTGSGSGSRSVSVLGTPGEMNIVSPQPTRPSTCTSVRIPSVSSIKSLYSGRVPDPEA